MTAEIDTSSEEYRHQCECREWLRLGYTTKDKVDGLMQRIAKRRGEAAAEKLRQGMRDEWQKIKAKGL